jgi:hypothetical protein
LGEKCLECSIAHGTLRLLCQIRAKKLTFDVKAVQTELFCFLTFVIQFTIGMLENAGID